MAKRGTRAGAPRANGSTAAWIVFRRRRHFLGRWATADLATLARDRAALHFGLEQHAFVHPGLARSVGAASPAELRDEADEAARRQ